ncbi:MAG: class I SAM-dependent methyltransferase [Patescibacteria group bacterium]|nr:class I SAM-dependent methyltransferase [Patescibacteria group bacterium]
MFECRKTCNLCGSEDPKILVSKDFSDPCIWDFLDKYYEGRIDEKDVEGGKYEIARCGKCGFMWQTQILDDSAMGKLYGRWISSEESLQKQQNDTDLLVVYKGEVATFITLIDKDPDEIDVLDFGMGWGHFCLTAKEFGCNAYGHELSEERIEFARGNGIGIVEDFTEGHKFDFINSEQVFEHIADPLGTLKMLASHLKEGGVIRIGVPNGSGVTRKLKNKSWKAAKDAIHPLEHINCFTHKTLKRLAKEAGLKFIKQPRIEVFRPGLNPYVKSLLGKHYRQRLGTTLYFKK